MPGAHAAVVAARRFAFGHRLRRLHDALAPTPIAGRYWVWSGLLLGWAREGRPLAHDLWDADFAFLAADEARFLASVPALVAAGFVPRSVYRDASGRVREYRLHRGPTQYDFFVMEPRPGPDGADGSVLRYHLFEPGGGGAEGRELICELADQARVPFVLSRRRWRKAADHDAELRAVYGTWRVPDPDWSFRDERTVVAERPWRGAPERWDPPSVHSPFPVEEAP